MADRQRGTGAQDPGLILAPDRLKATSLADRTKTTLQNLIVEGRYGPGDRLNEVELASALGVSRGPIREALQSLAGDGLVRIVRNRGAFVPAIDSDSVEQLYEVRLALETAAAGLAAVRRTDEEAEILQDLLASTERSMREDTDGAYPLDADLHRQIVQMARNVYLLNAVSPVHVLLKLTRSRAGHDPERARLAYREHLAIVDAIVRSEPALAVEAMRSHLSHSEHAVQAHLEVTHELDAPRSDAAVPE